MLSVLDNGFLLLFYALLNAPKNKLWFAGFYILHIYRYGCGIGPYIFSFAMQNLGYKAIYQICAWLIFIVLILYFFLIYKRKKASFLKKLVIINFDL